MVGREGGMRAGIFQLHQVSMYDWYITGTRWLVFWLVLLVLYLLAGNHLDNLAGTPFSKNLAGTMKKSSSGPHA